MREKEVRKHSYVPWNFQGSQGTRLRPCLQEVEAIEPRYVSEKTGEIRTHECQRLLGPQNGFCELSAGQVRDVARTLYLLKNGQVDLGGMHLQNVSLNNIGQF